MGKSAATDRHSLPSLTHSFTLDFVVLLNGTKEEAEALRVELTKFLKETLRLDLSQEKTRITHLNDGFDFLGYNIVRKMGHERIGTKVLIPNKSVENVIQKITKATDKTTHQDSVNTKILGLNQIIGGWYRYYQYTSEARTTFGRIEYRSFWKLAHWLGRKYQLAMPKVLRTFQQKEGLGTKDRQLIKALPTLPYKKRFLKPNPYTHQEKVQREEPPKETRWMGWEQRPGMGDLRPQILTRDDFKCQKCGIEVLPSEAQVDHKRPVRRFKRPVEANSAENLQTLCIPCHKTKTKDDRRGESRMPGKLARPVRRGEWRNVPIKTQENIKWPNGGLITSLSRQRALLLPYRAAVRNTRYATRET
jgi:RNA-directed DNA polymerase